MISIRIDRCAALWPLLLLLASAPAYPLPDTNTIEFHNCTLTMPGTTVTTAARCGWLEVPENPAAPEAAGIRLHVALAPAIARASETDPLFFFAGGPGQSAGEAYVLLRPYLEEVRKTRDIVLLDQRGTGQSHPLRCPPPDDEDYDTLESSVDLEQIDRMTRDCLAQLDGDPRFYTTTIAMGDYDRVRRAMGYGRINLLGVSYGTRAAQVYLRRYPDTVRSIILDSVVPMELALGQEHPQMLDRAVAAIAADCNRDEYCGTHYAAGFTGLPALMRSLRAQPREITLIHPATGVEQQLTVSADVLAFAIRFLSYSDRTQAVLPLLLNEAVGSGELSRLAGQAMLIGEGIAEQISHGMELSVICSEDFPYMHEDPAAAATILGDTFFKTLQASCRPWPRGEVPDDFHEPVSSGVPVLLLAGSRDPVTPPAYARQAARHFSHSLVLVAPGLGHSVSPHPCLRRIEAEFITLGSLEHLDTGCVERIAPGPFFTSILGPDP